MRRKIIRLAGVAAACIVFATSTASGDTFFSGTVDINGTIAGGNAIMFTNRDAAQGGVAYNNLWTSTSPAGPNVAAPGSYKITSMGFVPLTQARVGQTNMNLGVSDRLVAVYAFEGRGDIGVGSGIANFDPSDNVPGSSFSNGKAHGVIKIYNFGIGPSSPNLDNTNPDTWLPGGVTNSDMNVVAELRIDNRADAYLIGPPGSATGPGPSAQPGDTTLPQVISVGAVNTVPQDLTGAVFEARGDLKLVFNPDLLGDMIGSGLLFNNAQAMSAFLDQPNSGFVVNPDPAGTSQQATVTSPTTGMEELAFDLFSNLDEEAFVTGAQPLPNAMNIADMNFLFDALLDMPFGGEPGAHLFSDQSTPGDDLNTTQDFASGDITLEYQSFFGIPGAQFRRITTTPEPTALLAWVLVGCVGLGTYYSTRAVGPKD